MNLPTEQIDVKVVWPFVQATLDALRVQFSLESKFGKPRMKEEGDVVPRDLNAIVGLTGAAFTGTVIISFPEPLMRVILREALQEPEDPTPHMIDDSMAELLNIICGNAVKAILDKGYQIGRSVPLVVSGAGVKIRYLRGHSILLPVHTARGDFFIEVTTQKK